MTPGDDSQRPRHPIGVVVERTGLSPDVLRVWERRYGAVTPARSGAGQRLYSDADVERLVLLARATQGGRAVGSVVALSLAELRELVATDAALAASAPTPARISLERAYTEVVALAPERLHAELRTALLTLGTSAFLDDVLSPLLRRIGDAWHAGEIGIAHEHAASAVIRRLLDWLLATIHAPEDAPGVVVACAAGEHHELGALIAAVDATQAGWRVLHLGGALPADQVAMAARQHRATVAALSVVAPADPVATRGMVLAVERGLEPGAALVIGGAGSVLLGDLGAGVTVVRDLAHWRALLRVHAQVAA